MLAWFKRDKFDHPLASDNAARKIVDAFSYRDPCKTLEEAAPWLASINGTAEFSLQRRFELLDLFDDATRRSQERLHEDYVTLSQGNPQEKRLWQAASGFWNLLGDGYLACAQQCSSAEGIPDSMKPRVPLLAARGLRALRHHLKWAMLRYGALRNDFWSECGRFALLAEADSSAARPLEIFTGIAVSPYDELQRLLMFWAGAPSGLSPAEQDIAERLVSHVSPKLRCSASWNDGYDYFFDLHGLHPPVRCVPSAPVNAATRFFDVREARETLRAVESVVGGSASLPAILQWGPAAESNIVLRVLRHLRTHWAKEPPPRAVARQKTQTRLKWVLGFQNVLGLLAPALSQGVAAREVPRSDEWITDDVSSGGYGVIVPTGRGGELRVGMLVALRTHDESSWSIGIIRRVNELAAEQRQLGIQVLSRAALPVFLRTQTGVRQGRKQECGILLSARSSPAGYLFMVMRPDLFSGREPVEATFGDQDTPLTLGAGGVLQSGHDFDWLYYKFPGHAA